MRTVFVNEFEYLLVCVLLVEIQKFTAIRSVYLTLRIFTHHVENPLHAQKQWKRFEEC